MCVYVKVYKYDGVCISTYVYVHTHTWAHEQSINDGVNICDGQSNWIMACRSLVKHFPLVSPISQRGLGEAQCLIHWLMKGLAYPEMEPWKAGRTTFPVGVSLSGVSCP